jgi:hypothetical protein
MEKEKLIPEDATFEQFFSFIMERFDPELVTTFIEIGEYDTDFETLDTFLRSEMVTGRLERQWNHEKPERWTKSGRSVGLAIDETLGHFIARIRGNIEIYFHNGKGDFKDFEPENVLQIGENTQFLKDFFGIRFRNIRGDSS